MNGATGSSGTQGSSTPKVLQALGQTFIFRVTADETNDRYSVIEIQTPPGLGVPVHININEDETHLILRGKHRITSGEQIHEVESGEVVYVHRGTPHSFENIGSGEGSLILIASPGRNIENFLVALSEAFSDPLTPPLPDPRGMEVLMRLTEEYGVPSAAPPGQ